MSAANTKAGGSGPGGAGGPVAVVTGGSAGIGLAASRALTERGWRVLICGRDASKLGEAERGLSAAGEGSVAVCETDVGVEGGARRAVEAATERFGRLDALVNNAGYAPLEPISNTPREVYERSWAVNVMGPAEAIAAAWSAFEEQHTADPDTPGGRVVNVTTLGVADPFPGFAAYAAGKAGAASLARSVKNEGDGIGVLGFAVAPGAVETGMLRDLFDERTVPPDICLTPDEVGAVIAACACGERDADNGKTLYLTRSEGGGVEERVAAL